MKHGRILTRIARIFANSIRVNWRNSRQSLVAERKRLKNYFAGSKVKTVKQDWPLAMRCLILSFLCLAVAGCGLDETNHRSDKPVSREVASKDISVPFPTSTK